MPAIDIGEPLSNSSVNTTFRATGSFSPNTGTPVIVLRNSADAVIPGGAVMTPGNDVWFVDYSGLPAQTGVKLSADMAGVQGARETNITIQSAPPIIFGNITFAFSKGAKAASRTTVSGTYDSGAVDSIVVTAFEYFPEPRNAMDTSAANSSVLASAGATLTPGDGTWTCVLNTSDVSTNGNRMVFRAIALTKKGRIVGHAAKRRKV